MFLSLMTVSISLVVICWNKDIDHLLKRKKVIGKKSDNKNVPRCKFTKSLGTLEDFLYKLIGRFLTKLFRRFFVIKFQN